MEETKWSEDVHVLTHLLTSPTLSPSLHSQLLVSSRFPCYLHWNFPPFLCRSQTRAAAAAAGIIPLPLHLSWALSLFLKRVARFGLPETSWRCKCPFQQPPPLLLAAGVEPAPASLGPEQRRGYVRRRLRRRRFGSDVHPLIPFAVPNVLLLLLLYWNPLSLRVDM